MNAGVRTSPLGVPKRPARAPSGEVASSWKEKPSCIGCFAAPQSLTTVSGSEPPDSNAGGSRCGWHPAAHNHALRPDTFLHRAPSLCRRRQSGPLCEGPGTSWSAICRHPMMPEPFVIVGSRPRRSPTSERPGCRGHVQTVRSRPAPVVSRYRL